MPPQINLAPEITQAAKAATVTFTKWGQVADVLQSWHTPVIFIVGLVVGIFLVHALARKQS